jgi:hypothetical protein
VNVDREKANRSEHAISARHFVKGSRDVLMEVADLPLGHIAFLVIAVGGFYAAVWGALDGEAYIGAVAAASGLVAVGHGIRHQRRPDVTADAESAQKRTTSGEM